MDYTTRPLNAFEKDFYQLMLEHYAERLKAEPENGTIKQMFRQHKAIVNSQNITTLKTWNS